MGKAFESIKAGLTEAIAHARRDPAGAGVRVYRPHAVNVREVRQRVGLTQEQFAARFGFSVATLRHWAEPLDLAGHQVSYHVLESGDVAQALLAYARGNGVSAIVMGAATHGLMTQRLLATVPIKVAMDAPCTVILVKQALPFERLQEQAAKLKPIWDRDRDAPF